MANNKNHQDEAGRLRRLVRNEWTALVDAEDEFGTDAANQIDAVFSWPTNQLPEVIT